MFIIPYILDCVIKHMHKLMIIQLVVAIYVVQMKYFQGLVLMMEIVGLIGGVKTHVQIKNLFMLLITIMLFVLVRIPKDRQVHLDVVAGVLQICFKVVDVVVKIQLTCVTMWIQDHVEIHNICINQLVMLIFVIMMLPTLPRQMELVILGGLPCQL